MQGYLLLFFKPEQSYQKNPEERGTNIGYQVKE